LIRAEEISFDQKSLENIDQEPGELRTGAAGGTGTNAAPAGSKVKLKKNHRIKGILFQLLMLRSL
jgi:hypothetical protein